MGAGKACIAPVLFNRQPVRFALIKHLTEYPRDGGNEMEGEFLRRLNRGSDGNKKSGIAQRSVFRQKMVRYASVIVQG